MNELININTAMSETQAEAVKLHQSIMLNAEMAANSMVAMCRDLKTMRDRKLYEELGCSEFGEYTEKLVGIKERQAYTYISTYEKLGDTVLQSNATLGITKLSLIAQMNAEDRQELLASGEAEDKSVAEIKKLLEENKNQGEQIRLLQEELKDYEEQEYGFNDAVAERDKAWAEVDELNKEIAKLQSIEGGNKIAEDSEAVKELNEKITELEEELAAEKAKKAEPAPAIDKKKLKKEIEDKLAAEHNKKLEAERKKAREEGAKEAEERAKEQIELLKNQIETSQRHSEQLQKELELSDSASAEAMVYINSIQQDFNSLISIISQMPEEQGDKFRGAVIKLCAKIKESCEK